MLVPGQNALLSRERYDLCQVVEGKLVLTTI